jgi:quinohemoprotein ethanol dehydrogenase
MAPDLRASPIVLSAKAFDNIVRDGTRQFRSMQKYSTLSDADLLALRHYIRQRAEHVQP